MSAIDSVFEALFFGSGSLLGILLILVLCIGLMMKWKETVVLVLPIIFLFGIQFVDRGLAYQSLIMFLSGVFMLLYSVKQFKD